MYCPKCSQQQTSDEMRFCSRCGFPLEGVALIVNNEGIVPANLPDRKLCSSRGKMIRESIYLTLIAWAITLSATLFFDAGGPWEIAARVGGILFFLVGLIGLLRFIYAFVFVRDAVPALARPSAIARSPGSVINEPARAALGAQQGIPVSDYPRRTHTKEMVAPPSVTENTTRLLQDQPGPK